VPPAALSVDITDWAKDVSSSCVSTNVTLMPASLIALLRSVSVSWQQQAQTENAQKIAAAAQEFYARVVKFTEHFEKIRAGLDRANSAFNEAAASFQTRVRPAGERLTELGGTSTPKPLPEVPPVEGTLRLW